MRTGWRLGALLAVGVPLLGGVDPAAAQGVFSYVDAAGVRTLTNIPPSVPVRELEMSPSAVAAVHQRAAGDAAPETTEPAAKPPLPSRYDGAIQKYSDEFRLDPALIRAMIVQESNFNPKAVSRKGACGLMQLMPETALRFGVRNIFDPDENIRGGVRYMRLLLDLFRNDLALSLAAYNAGENLVQRLGRIPAIAETRGYVRSITRRYGRTTHPRTELAEVTGPAPVYRFTDASGVTHLTNLAPVRTPGHATAGTPVLTPE